MDHPATVPPTRVQRQFGESPPPAGSPYAPSAPESERQPSSLRGKTVPTPGTSKSKITSARAHSLPGGTDPKWPSYSAGSFPACGDQGPRDPRTSLKPVDRTSRKRLPVWNDFHVRPGSVASSPLASTSHTYLPREPGHQPGAHQEREDGTPARTSRLGEPLSYHLL